MSDYGGEKIQFELVLQERLLIKAIRFAKGEKTKVVFLQTDIQPTLTIKVMSNHVAPTGWTATITVIPTTQSGADGVQITVTLTNPAPADGDVTVAVWQRGGG